VPAKKTPGPLPKDKLSVLTLNVYSYLKCTGAMTCNIINDLLQQYKPDLACTQEDWLDASYPYEIEPYQFQGYAMVSQCKAEKFYGEDMSNRIYIRNDLLNLASNSAEIDITDQCGTLRCASVATIKGITIANLHMCGGRYDDMLYHK
jgi:hypothetical protein